MLYLKEEVAVEMLSRAPIIDWVAEAFTAMAQGGAYNYPVVRESCEHGVFGIKSGVDPDNGALGLKAGGYWPGNESKGLTNHQSSVVLFDQHTGCVDAIVSGNRLTAARTAAASALSIKHLAREDASTLMVLGAGAQVSHQIDAALKVRPFERLIIWNRNTERAERIAASLDYELSVDVSADIDIVAEADVIITVTPATTPLLQKEMVSPGTHIAAMGSDTAGKRELAIELVSNTSFYTDVLEQSASIGELQDCDVVALQAENRVRGEIGQLICGMCSGRQSDEDITIFDSTGVALQDLVAARRLVEQARAAGLGIEI